MNQQTPVPLEVHFDRPATPPPDWNLVSEVRIFAPIFTPEIKALLNQARKNGKTLRGMDEASVNAMNDYVTEH